MKRAPFSVVFLFLFPWEGIIFSQTEVVEAPQCFTNFPLTLLRRRCCHDNAL